MFHTGATSMWTWTSPAAGAAGLSVQRTRRWHRSYTTAILAGLALLLGV